MNVSITHYNFESDSCLSSSAYNVDLNRDITIYEVQAQVKRSKNNKSPGTDLIINEFLKYSPPAVLALLTTIFNVVLTSGKVPRDWIVGKIKPLFKGKGSINQVDNYRGITLVSCVGKLFTAILNERINSYLSYTGIFGDE